jgi:predicted ATPase/ribosome-binding protein aMBF1 (putative translation factor)
MATAISTKISERDSNSGYTVTTGSAGSAREDGRCRGPNVVAIVQDERRLSTLSHFGLLLRRLRLAAGLSQETLAERARMSVNGVGALERGYRRSPQRETLALLAGALALNAEQRREFEEAACAAPGRRLRSASVTIGPWSESAVPRLPLSLASFVGRERELREITALLHEHRLVTITGAGGVGKTQTAVRVASALGEAGDTPIRFVGLAPVDNPSRAAAAIASMLGVQEVSNHSLLETLVAFLRSQTLLLVLDNCEHVITETAVIIEMILGSCPSVRILATSREPLKAAGEHAYRLPSLSAPSAVVLFTDRARAVDHGFTLTEETAPVVAGLCRRLDGIPLAIELAAARVNLLPVKAIAERVGDNLRILTGGARTAVPRQQTMRATIDWSYNLLSTPEKALFEGLSVFSGGCALATAERVCTDKAGADGEIEDLLSSLVDKSLVAANLQGHVTRYTLLESFRQYAREKLAASGEAHAVARRHALALFTLAERLDEPDDYWRVLARDEMDNWRAALQWALTDRGDVLLGQRLTAKLRVIWQELSQLEGQRFVRSALELAEGATPVSVLADLNFAMADVAWALRERELHLASSRRAMAYYLDADDVLGVARARARVGHALMSLGREAEAVPVLEEALAQAHVLGDSPLVAYIVRCLGSISSTKHGDIVAARNYITEALEIYESLGAKADAAWALNDLGQCELCVGDAEPAFRHASDAVAILRDCNIMRGAAVVLGTAAMALTLLANYDEAEEHALEGLTIARENDARAIAVWGLQHIAAIAALRPHADEVSRRIADSKAARLLGFVNKRLSETGAVRMGYLPLEYDRAYSALRSSTSADALRNLMADGAAMSEEQALEAAYC